MKKVVFVVLAMVLSVSFLQVSFASENKGSGGGSVKESVKGSGRALGVVIEPEAKKAAQQAMAAHIEHVTCANDVCKLGDVEAEFDYLHEGVKSKGAFLISCADFKVGEDVYDVDYYVLKLGEMYIVKKEVIHKINGEEKNEVVWKVSDAVKEKGSGKSLEMKGSGSPKEMKGSDSGMEMKGSGMFEKKGS